MTGRRTPGSPPTGPGRWPDPSRRFTSRHAPSTVRLVAAVSVGSAAQQPQRLPAGGGILARVLSDGVKQSRSVVRAGRGRGHGGRDSPQGPAVRRTGEGGRVDAGPAGEVGHGALGGHWTQGVTGIPSTCLHRRGRPGSGPVPAGASSAGGRNAAVRASPPSVPWRDRKGLRGSPDCPVGRAVRQHSRKRGNGRQAVKRKSTGPCRGDAGFPGGVFEWRLSLPEYRPNARELPGRRGHSANSCQGSCRPLISMAPP